MRFFLIFILAANFSFAFDFSIFPKAKNGEIMQILELAPLENEDEKLVKIEFGKNLELDCNSYFFTDGNLTNQNLKGFGYEYYKLKAKGLLAGTLMYCGDGVKKEKFVKFEPEIYKKYSSKLPFVFYTPKDVKVKYSIFSLEKSEILDQKAK